MGWKNQRLWGSPGGSPTQLLSDPIISTKLRVFAINIRRFFLSFFFFMKVGHILRLWNLILTSSVEPKMKPAVSLSNTPFISITEERQEAQKHQMKWVSCAVSDAWELCRNSELPSRLLSESPQLSTSTLDLLTELCLASFKIKKKVPLFKRFFIAGWLWERGRLPLKLKWTYKYLSLFFPTRYL